MNTNVGTADATALTELINRKGNMREVSIAIGIPYETLRDWCYGRRKPASYVLAAARVKIANLPDGCGNPSVRPATQQPRYGGTNPAAGRQRLSAGDLGRLTGRAR